MNNFTLLVVDDEVDFGDFVVSALEDDYSVSYVDSGNKAISQIERNPPDLVILDINMPDVDGYEVCRQIKSARGEQTAVLFVSGQDTTQEKMKAYELGGDDFLSKPVMIDELIVKVQVLEKFVGNQKKMKAHGDQTTKMALRSMEESAHYGLLFQFLKQSFECSSYPELAKELFTLLTALDLSCTLQIRSPQETYSLTESGDCSPIEEEIMTTLHEKSRLFPFNQRMLVNDKNITILVKNMPVDNEFATGHLQDILAATIEACQASYQHLTHRLALKDLLGDVQSTLDLAHNKFESHEACITKIMSELLAEIESGLHVLGLTEEQELFYGNVVSKSMNRLMDAHNEAKTIEDCLTDISNKVSNSVS